LFTQHIVRQPESPLRPITTFAILSSYHIIWICYGTPIRNSEAPYKVKYRLNSTTNRWYGYRMQC